jgi:hypothetical protein
MSLRINENKTSNKDVDNVILFSYRTTVKTFIVIHIGIFFSLKIPIRKYLLTVTMRNGLLNCYCKYILKQAADEGSI